MRTAFTLAMVGAFSCAAFAAEPETARQEEAVPTVSELTAGASTPIETSVVSLKHGHARQVVPQVVRAVRKSLHDAGDAKAMGGSTPIVILPTSADDAVVVICAKQHASLIKQTVAACDAPHQYAVKIQLFEIAADGETVPTGKGGLFVGREGVVECQTSSNEKVSINIKTLGESVIVNQGESAAEVKIETLGEPIIVNQEQSAAEVKANDQESELSCDAREAEVEQDSKGDLLQCAHAGCQCGPECAASGCAGCTADCRHNAADAGSKEDCAWTGSGCPLEADVAEVCNSDASKVRLAAGSREGGWSLTVNVPVNCTAPTMKNLMDLCIEAARCTSPSDSHANGDAGRASVRCEAGQCKSRECEAAHCKSSQCELGRCDASHCKGCQCETGDCKCARSDANHWKGCQCDDCQCNVGQCDAGHCDVVCPSPHLADSDHQEQLFSRPGKPGIVHVQVGRSCPDTCCPACERHENAHEQFHDRLMMFNPRFLAVRSGARPLSTDCLGCPAECCPHTFGGAAAPPSCLTVRAVPNGPLIGPEEPPALLTLTRKGSCLNCEVVSAPPGWQPEVWRSYQGRPLTELFEFNECRDPLAQTIGRLLAQLRAPAGCEDGGPTDVRVVVFGVSNPFGHQHAAPPAKEHSSADACASCHEEFRNFLEDLFANANPGEVNQASHRSPGAPAASASDASDLPPADLAPSDSAQERPNVPHSKIDTVQVTYPLRDLVLLDDEGRPVFDTCTIIDHLQTAVAPETWSHPSVSMQLDQQSVSLVIRQTHEVHAKIDAHLSYLRRLQVKQICSLIERMSSASKAAAEKAGASTKPSDEADQRGE